MPKQSNVTAMRKKKSKREKKVKKKRERETETDQISKQKLDRLVSPPLSACLQVHLPDINNTTKESAGDLDMHATTLCI